MSEKRHALSIRAVAREVLQVYRRHWTFLIPAAVVILLPQAIVDGFLDGFHDAGVDSARDIAILAAIPMTVAVSIGGEALYAGFAASAVVEWRAGHPVPGPVALVRSLPIGTLIAVDLILTVAASIGFVFLVLPGLVLLTYAGIAPAVVKFEHRGVWGAFKRSALLVQGHFWRVLVIVVGLMIFTEIATEAISAPFHGAAATAAVDLVAEGVLEPLQGLATVIVTLSLLELRGELPAPDELALAPAAGG